MVLARMNFLSFVFSTSFDWCKQAHQKGWLERGIVRLAAWGFVIHLVLIALAISFQSLQTGILAGPDRNFLYTIYTPFSLIFSTKYCVTFHGAATIPEEFYVQTIKNCIADRNSSCVQGYR